MNKKLLEERIHTVTCIIQALKDAGARVDHIMKYQGEKKTLLEILDGKYESND